jgi:Kef-type K+ transport system membrane component KefB
MELLYIILVLLAVSRMFAEIAERFQFPPLVGELVAGIALGLIGSHYSGLFPVLAHLPENEVFLSITDVSIFFLMLLAGTELHPRELVGATSKAMAVALGGMLLPLATGFAIGWYFLPESDFKLAQSLFIATALSITAVPVSVRVLMDIGKLKTPVGQTIVSAAVFDDVISLLLLAILTAVVKNGNLPDLAALGWMVGKIVLFFIITSVIGLYLFPRLGKLIRSFSAEEFEFSALLIAALAYSLIAEKLGLHFIIGAFLAGLFFVHRTIEPEVYRSTRDKLNTCTVGLFAPLFFASIGMQLDLSAATAIPGFVILLIAAAFLGKILGAGAPAYWTGFSRRDSLAVGVGMSARGAVELIIAGIALQAGLFEHPQPAPPEVKYLFSAIVIVAIVTTLISPLLLKWIFDTNDE